MTNKIISCGSLYPFTWSIKQKQPFSFKTLYSHPGELKFHDQNGPRKNIAIVGAGIAGLSAAYELEQCDHKVSIYEKTSRCGGRIFTKRFSDGSYSELGAMRIPANHECTLHYIKKFNLATRRFVNFNPQAYFYLRGAKSRLKEIEEAGSQFDLHNSERKDPFKIYESIMTQAIEKLSQDEKWEMFLPHIESPILKEYDKITLRQYLERFLSQEAIEFVGHATGMIHYERASLLEALIDYFGLFRVDQLEIVGGMDQLTNGFLKCVKGEIKTNALVKKIEMKQDGIAINWKENDYLKSKTFDYVIVTAPAPAVALIDFEPALPAHQQSAFWRLSYARSAKTLCHFSRRFWETEDGIHGGGSFTDLPIQQIWYPSDNSRDIGNEKVLGFTGDDYSSTSKHSTAQNEAISYGPGVMTASYLWEGNVAKFAALSKSEREELVLKNLLKIHPQAEKYLLSMECFIWDEQANPGNGAFAFFAPGEHERYQANMCRPYPENSPRLFFAGEHTAIAHAWIQGAIQSGIAAALEIVKRQKTNRIQEDASQNSA